MKHKNSVVAGLLRNLELGSSVAELDELLESSRVETSAFTDLLGDKIDLVPGTKGSGKSALFRVFTDFMPAFLLMQKKIVVAHGVQRQGDAIFQAFKDEFQKLNEDDFVDFWSIYLVSLAHEQFIKGEAYQNMLQGCSEEIEDFRSACQRANIPEIKASKSFVEILGWALAALKSYAPRVKYSPPGESGEFELDLFGNLSKAPQLPNKIHRLDSNPEPPSYILEIKENLEKILIKIDSSIWLMVDKLDELFPRRSELESRALRGLLKAMRLFSSSQIRVKVFLRDDMLDALVSEDDGFTALTHITARKADTLKWTEDQLLAMIVKRFYANHDLRNYLGVDVDKLNASIEYRKQSFYKIFPPTVHRGTRQSSTIRWICSHACDGKGVVTPRDVIELLTKAKQRQQDECAANDAGETESIINSSSILYGMKMLSEYKRVTYLKAEFPHLWPEIEKFTGGKATFSEERAKRIVGGKSSRTLEDLHSIGFLEKGVRKGKAIYSIPYVYRKALDVTQGQDV